MNYKDKLQEAYKAGYHKGLREQKKTLNEQMAAGDATWPGLLFYLTYVSFGDTTPIALQSVDYNDDGVVDFQDLLILLGLWSEGSPPMTAQEYIDGTYSANNNKTEPFDGKKISKIISKAAKSKRPSSKLSKTVNEQMAAGVSWPGMLNFMMTYGFRPNPGPEVLRRSDYNDDGAVDFQDLLILLQLWGNGSPGQTAEEYIDGIYSINEPDPSDVKKISKIISKVVKSKLPSSRLPKRK